MLAALLNILLKLCIVAVADVAQEVQSVIGIDSARRLLQLLPPDLLRVDAPSVHVVGVPGGSLSLSVLLDR